MSLVLVVENGRVTALFFTALFVLGLCVGSFGNVVIWRVPKRDRAGVGDGGEGAHDDSVIDEVLHADDDLVLATDETVAEEVAQAHLTSQSVVQPSSYCPSCRTPLQWYDNVPLVSWLALRGRCRYCTARIPARYPLVELLNAILWVLVGWRFGLAWETPAYLVLATGLLILSAIDLELYLLPNRIVYPLGFSTGALLAVASFGTGDWLSLRTAVITAVVSFVAFFVMHLVFAGGMGFGDVRLSFVLGLALGWLGWQEAFLGFFLAFLLGSLIGVALILFGKRGRKQAVPFGQFMAAGAMIAVLAGPWVLARYGAV